VIILSTILELRDVVKIFSIGVFGRTLIKAVDRVSLTVQRGEILGLLGESGSGKSTIAKLILKILKPTSGYIFFKGRDIWKVNDREYYRRVQGVFQDPYASFNPRRKVLDIFLDVVRNYYGTVKSGNHEQVLDTVKPVLERVGLSTRDVVDRYPHEFSGGQLQRLSIARALLVKPELIIADEPVSMVDASTRIDILNIFIDLKEKEGLTSIIIGHDLSLIGYVSDRVVVLYKGQVVEEGPASTLVDPAHPYTKMLLEAVPRIESKWTKQQSYEVLESLKSSGCVFAPRCPHRMNICTTSDPPYTNLGKTRVKCWLYAPR
jgi:peptide/nickel transport system ATP-binding protein